MPPLYFYYLILFFFYPFTCQFHPCLAFFLYSSAVFVACLFICKAKTMSANRIKMPFYRYFEFPQCIKK